MGTEHLAFNIIFRSNCPQKNAIIEEMPAQDAIETSRFLLLLFCQLLFQIGDHITMDSQE